MSEVAPKMGETRPSTGGDLWLKEQVARDNELFQETGHLFGLERLARKESDPGTYEAVWHILSNVCETAWKTGCKVSSSPIAAPRSGAWSPSAMPGTTSSRSRRRRVEAIARW